ncbi:MAG: GNAT family N-acetyltransferase [Gammaproteobacteria bacterium]|nr:GNAT family N-acetyltransferase [Gammaproteobacteria bacterium]
MDLTDRLREASITVAHAFEPGDLGELIRIHGVGNARDYGFNAVHEGYCAQIAAGFILDADPRRSRVWLAKRASRVVGSVFICECPDNTAQLRLLYADASVRGLGLGRWLVEAVVDYCRHAGFSSVFLWTVEGLERALAVYTALGFVLTESKDCAVWGRPARELRYQLALDGPAAAR